MENLDAYEESGSANFPQREPYPGPKRPDRFPPADAIELPAASHYRQEYYRPRIAGEIPWVQIGIGVSLALAIAVCVSSAIGMLVQFFSDYCAGLLSMPGPFEVIVGGTMLVLGFVLGGCATFVLTGLVCLLSLTLLSMLMKLLSIQLRVTPVACFAGGLVGFMVGAALGSPEELSITYGVIISIATAAGQIGAGYFVVSHDRIPWFGKAHQFNPAGDTVPSVQFSLWQLLILMTIGSLACAVLTTVGLLDEWLLVLVTVWAVVQCLPLWLIVRLTDYRHERYLRRLLGTTGEQSCSAALHGSEDTEPRST